MQQGPLPRALVIPMLVGISVTFGANHISARIAFDHGTNVLTAVATRSAVATVLVLALMALQGVPRGLAPRLRLRALAVGALIAVQSYCLYSAVALIPVALALLAFNLFPLLFTLLSAWAGGERLTFRTALAMPAALAGLALVLNVVGGARHIAGRWTEIGVGVGYALGAAVSFALVLFLTNRWLKEMDGRARTLYTMAVVTVVMLAAGAATGGFAAPKDATGWLALALLSALYSSALIVFFLVLPRVGAPSNTVALNAEPIAVMVMAWAVLGQAMSTTQVLGAFVVVGAITWLAMGRH
jgi:drug/metabolite transporter (DMT)-like permease